MTVASFDVDAQKTFTPLCPDELPVPGGDQIVAELNAQAEFAAYRVGSRDAHPANAHWVAERAEDVGAPVEGANLDIRWPAHAIVGTRGFELLDGLPHPVTGYDFFVSKGLDPDCHPYGACYHDLDYTVSTGVLEYLASRKVRTVIVGGLALDHCVKETVLQLRQEGFDVYVNLAATRGIDADSSDAAIEQMRQAGAEFINYAEQMRSILRE